jgi:hypothetical protein
MAAVCLKRGLVPLAHRDNATKRTAQAHMLLNMVVLILEITNLWIRATRKGHFFREGTAHASNGDRFERPSKSDPPSPVRTGWVLSLVSVALLSVSGWLGQHLVRILSEPTCQCGPKGWLIVRIHQVYVHGFAVSKNMTGERETFAPIGGMGGMRT